VRIVSSKVNVVELLVSMLAVRVFSGCALTNCLSLAGRDCTFDGSTFYVDLTISKGFGFSVRVKVQGARLGIDLVFCIRMNPPNPS